MTHRLTVPDDALVVLDPAVEILDDTVDDHALLCHTALEVGMAVPPGEGLLDVVRSLMGEPVRVGDLRAEYDDTDIFDEIFTSLVHRGFAHVTPPPVAAAPEPRRAIIIDLDSVSDVAAAWLAGGATPEVLLRCARLVDRAAILRDLAIRRRDGSLRAHHVVVRAHDVRCDDATRDSLLRLGAAVEIDRVEWPAPAAPIAGLAELVRGLIPTHVIMSPGASLLDEPSRERCIAWISRSFVSGLCLRLEANTSDTAALFDAIRELEDRLGDVVVVNLPGDEVVLGNTDRGWLAGEATDTALRRDYVRWRIPLLKQAEGRTSWGQVPSVEDKWVRTEEDLLPSSPALLGIRNGSRIVDLCGGMGRVARRLSSAVGIDGLVISIEKRRAIVERARRFALEGNFTNLQFRVGLAERVSLHDGAVDAAVNEWTGAVWELGLGPAMVSEMARVVRPGGRAAVTHRLVQLPLDELHQPWVQYPKIYRWVRDAFHHAELAILAERVWGQITPSHAGDHASLWREALLPWLVDPNDYVFSPDDPARGSGNADVFLTTIAEVVRRDAAAPP
jgi:SAM-dependent methyltransferase